TGRPFGLEVSALAAVRTPYRGGFARDCAGSATASVRGAPLFWLCHVCQSARHRLLACARDRMDARRLLARARDRVECRKTPPPQTPDPTRETRKTPRPHLFRALFRTCSEALQTPRCSLL